MICQVYQLVSPRQFETKYKDIGYSDNFVLVRPTHLSICHADLRYYTGQRNPEILRKKLPMALIHECTGIVVNDPTGKFKKGERVMLIPNTPFEEDEIIDENYLRSSCFRGSGYDGFMQEYIQMRADRLVGCDGIEPTIAAIGEFISVGVHAIESFLLKSHRRRGHVGIWGDGSLGFVVACLLRRKLPDVYISVIGRHPAKLAYFTFADNVFVGNNLPADFEVDHAFECVGGESGGLAIEQIINCICPQGTIILMGVSEVPIPITTRKVLEKGLTLVGRSRSGRADFEKVKTILLDTGMQTRFKTIISATHTIRNIADIHIAFEDAQNNAFKTVLYWEI